MTKKQKLGFGGGVILMALICTVTVLHFSGRNAPDLPIEDDAAPLADAGAFEIEDAQTPQAAAPAEIPVIEAEAPQVIPDESVRQPENPSKETIEKETETGEVVQTHDWDAQKTQAEATPPPPQTPQNGSSKTIDGQSYTYVEGFGWVKDGNGNVGTVVEVEITGNQVGH